MSGIKHLSQIDMQVAPTQLTHVVTLGHLNDAMAGRVKNPVLATTVEPLTATYDPASKTLTATANGAWTVDGIPVATSDRVLLKDQIDKTQNGIYVVTQTGDAGSPLVLARASDFDSSSELISGGSIYVAAGTSNRGEWLLSSPPPLTLDASNLEFVRATGASEAVKAGYDITGDGVNAQFNFSHSWGTRDVLHALYDDTTGEAVQADFRCTSINDVRITFGTPPEIGENYRLVVTAVLDRV